MAFSERTKDFAYWLASGRCQCARMACGHGGVCNIPLSRHFDPARLQAQFHHIHASALSDDDSPSNCEVICYLCHVNTDSYGRVQGLSRS